MGQPLCNFAGARQAIELVQPRRGFAVGPGAGGAAHCALESLLRLVRAPFGLAGDAGPGTCAAGRVGGRCRCGNERGNFAFHFPLAGGEAGDVALELGLLGGELDELRLVNGDLGFEIELTAQCGFREVVARLIDGELGAFAELGELSLGVCQQTVGLVARGHRTGQFLAHVVGRPLDLAHGLAHHHFGVGRLQSVDDAVGASRNETLYAKN